VFDKNMVIIFFTAPLHAKIFWLPHLKQELFFNYPTIFSSAPTPAINNDRSLKSNKFDACKDGLQAVKRLD
jgi:hypothetical protein